MLTERAVMAVFFGYSVGFLPHSSTAWTAVHLAFIVVLLVALVMAHRRDAA